MGGLWAAPSAALGVWHSDVMAQAIWVKLITAERTLSEGNEHASSVRVGRPGQQRRGDELL